MSLVKSMRKNSNKIMVFLLIFIMVGFVLGASLPAIIRQFTSWFSSGKSVAVYGDNVKVDYHDLRNAQIELKILRELMADQFLMATDRNGNPKMKNLLLSQVLFPDQRMAAFISSQLKYSAAQMREGSLQATGEEIDAFFDQVEGRNDIYWLLLKAEAQNAGIAVTDAFAKDQLRMMIPALTNQNRDAAMVVSSISNNYRKSSDEIVRIFAELLSVTEYASNVLTNEDVTIAQVKSLVGLSGEKIESEMVRFNVSPSSEPNLPEPTEEEITAQFNKYKDSAAGVYTKENPYGFGYKQPATVVLEYMIVKLDDVEKIIDAPTPQEMEDFYQNNLQGFTDQLPIDPNKPEGEKRTVTKDYSDVAANIRDYLIRQSTSMKADQIMIEAVEIVDKGFTGIDMEKPTSELYKKYAGDYKTAGEKITEKYAIPVYTGKTGQLSFENLSTEQNLRFMMVPSTRGTASFELAKLAFAIDEIGEIKLGRFDPTIPKMWQNIGPLQNGQERLISLVRVVQAKKEYAPESQELKYDIHGVILDKNVLLSENIYNLKDDIVKDLKDITSVKIAREQANKFVSLLEGKSWEEAIKEFNETLGDNDITVEPIRLSTQKDKTRSSLRDKKTLEIRSSSMPISSVKYLTQMREIDSLLQNELYELIPEGETDANDISTIVEFQPQRACFVVKQVSHSQVTIEDYQKNKSMIAFSMDITRSDALALIHYSPENIIKRMGFEATNKTSDTEEAKDGMDDADEDDSDKNSKDGDA